MFSCFRNKQSVPLSPSGHRPYDLPLAEIGIAHVLIVPHTARYRCLLSSAACQELPSSMSRGTLLNPFHSPNKTVPGTAHRPPCRKPLKLPRRPRSRTCSSALRLWWQTVSRNPTTHAVSLPSLSCVCPAICPCRDRQPALVCRAVRSQPRVSSTDLSRPT